MKNEEIINIITNPLSITKDNIIKIRLFLDKYPYFQSGHILLAIGLLNINSNHYNIQLKKAAIYSIDRYKLFNHINKKRKNNNLKFTSEDNLEIGKPLDFNKHETYSFSEWLSLSSDIKKIKRNDNKNQENIIHNFITHKQVNKHIKDNFFNASKIAKESLVNNSEIITPTLAKVYLEQGHYEKAISAYKALSLRYPEKISLFANQIKLIDKLKKQ